MMTVPNCQLCTRPVNSSSLQEPASVQGKLFSKSVKHLWSYLYHQNVRETLSPSVTSAATAAAVERGVGVELPKLAFTLYWGGGQNPHGGNDQTVQLCWQCYEHIDKLDQLHQQLEQVKRLVEVQVKRIDNLCQSSAASWSRDGGHDLNKIVSHSIFQNGRGEGMSMAGVSSGKENISQLIRFMATICEGMPVSTMIASGPSSGNSSSNPPETLARTGTEYTTENSHTSKYFTGHHSVPHDAYHRYHHNQATSGQVNVVPHFLEQSTENGTHGKDYTVLLAPRSFGNVNHERAELVNVTVAVDPLAVDDDSNSMVSNRSTEFRSPSIIIPSTSAVHPFVGEKSLSSTRGRRKRKRPETPPSSDSGSLNAKPCPVCGKLIKKNHMTVHMRVHSGEKPFRCELCDARFTQKCHLTTHLRLHTGETPYSCEICLLSFHRRDKLKKHKLKTHHLYS